MLATQRIDVRLPDCLDIAERLADLSAAIVSKIDEIPYYAGLVDLPLEEVRSEVERGGDHALAGVLILYEVMSPSANLAPQAVFAVIQDRGPLVYVV